MTTGEKLQKLRKDNDYTQEELAEIMSVSRQSISKWESDIAFPETEKLIALSKLYHCSIDYLLNEDSAEKMGNNKGNKTPYNKKRLPLIIFTLAFLTIAEVIYLFGWFPIETSVTLPTGYTSRVIIHLNIYQMATMNEYSGANMFPAMLILTGVIIQGLCVAYIFADSKSFSVTIKILNCVYSVFAFSVLVMGTIPCEEKVLTWPIMLFVLSLFVVILQFAITPIRKTR